MGNIITLARDSLTSLVSRMGTDRDKAATVFYNQPILSDEQIIAAYRGSWLPRKIVDIPALDSCRKWRDWQAQKPQIEAIETEEKRLNVKGKVLETSKKGRLFGGAALLIGTGDQDPSAPLEVERISKGGLKYLTVLTRRTMTAGEIDRDLTSEFYGRPKYYQVSGANGLTLSIHPSRLVIFNGAMAPDTDLDYWQGQGWGESVLVSTLDAIKNADSTAGNIASLVFEAKIDVIRLPNFMASLGNEEYKRKILERYTLANTAKGINGTLMLDKEEEYDSKSASLGGLTDIMMAFMQIVAGAADIPVTRLLGQSPAGMNSTGTADMKNYHDRIQSMQELENSPAMARLDECLMRSADGSRDPSIYYRWSPLEQMSESDRATIFKTTADAARQLVGTTSGQEIIPREAVSDALVNRLVEDGVLPGLDAAIEKYGSLAENEPTEEEQAAAAALAAKQVPAIQQEQKPGVQANANDAAPRTLYVSRKVLNADDLISWAKGQGFTTTLPADELHVTVIYSKTPVDWMAAGQDYWSDDGTLTIPPGGPRVISQFDGGAIVLEFSSSALSWRHEEFKRIGAQTSYPDFSPHITITYDPRDVDLSKVKPYQGEIVLGPETFAEVNDDWQSDVAEMSNISDAKAKRSGHAEHHSFGHHSFDPNQPRAGNGQWKETGASEKDGPLLKFTSKSQDEIADEILAIAKREHTAGAKVLALRVDDLEDEAIKGIGQSLPPSRIWKNGDPTQKTLDGTSAILLSKTKAPTRQDVDNALDLLYGERGWNSSKVNYFGKTVYLVKGASSRKGKDLGEGVIKDPVVVGLFRKTDNIGPLTGSSEANKRD